VEMTGGFKLVFVITAYAPLYLIAAQKFWLIGNHPLGVALAVLAILSALIALGFSRRLNVGEAKPYAVEDAKRIDNEIFPYLMTYIPLIIGSDFSKPEVAIPVLTLYFIIFLLYLRLNSPYVHPILALTGIRIYGAKVAATGRSIVILSAADIIDARETIRLHEVATSFLYFYDGES
jgi:hypothetical protein